MITLRQEKGSPLTHEELDKNIQQTFGFYNMFYAEERITSDVPSSTSWTPRNLNTIVVNNIPNMDLINKEIVFPIGKYWIEGLAFVYASSANILRFDNIIGVLGHGHSASYSSGHSFINGYLDISEQKNISLEHKCNTSNSPNGFGWHSISDTPYAVTSTIKIWKIGD